MGVVPDNLRKALDSQVQETAPLNESMASL